MVLRFFLLAVAFLLSCTEISRDNPLDEKSSHYGEVPKDDIDVGREWWNAEQIEFKFTDPRDKKVYKAIEFNVKKQVWKDNGDGSESLADIKDDSVYYSITWMAQNLNYNAPGSVCYNKDEANCTTYGRLYDFETAKTACPDGWRLPTSGEIDIYNGNGNLRYGIAAALGYEECYTIESNHNCVSRWIVGLGGFGSNGSFRDLDFVGYWWTSTEFKADNAYSIQGQMKNQGTLSDGTPYIAGELKKSIDDKSNFLSVHCVQD